ARRCIACGQVWRTKDLKYDCCPECRTELKPLQDGFCPGCGTVYTAPGESVYLCLDCRQNPAPWSRLGFFNIYSGMLKNLIIDFKFNSNLGLSRLLQRLMHMAYKLHHWESPPDVLVPVPLHPRRLRQRGFNQSREMAERIAAKEGVGMLPSALNRVKHTKSQVGLSREQREKNLTEAIEINSKYLSGKNVLLVDDIYTTGATTSACAHVLNLAGAKRVDVLVLARVIEGLQ
ncbi:MAG: ComF family protein, partial [Thermodesulfobacteriota bacterium]